MVNKLVRISLAIKKMTVKINQYQWDITSYISKWLKSKENTKKCWWGHGETASFTH